VLYFIEMFDGVFDLLECAIRRGILSV
jgi:hypothetical protein